MGVGSVDGHELLGCVVLVCLCLFVLCTTIQTATNRAFKAPSNLTSEAIIVFQTKLSHDIPKANVK